MKSHLNFTGFLKSELTLFLKVDLLQGSEKLPCRDQDPEQVQRQALGRLLEPPEKTPI